MKCAMMMFVFTVLVFITCSSFAQSWDVSGETAGYMSDNLKACKMAAPLSSTLYVGFAKKVFDHVEKKDSVAVQKLCAEKKDDAVKGVVCNLALYLVDKDGARFADEALSLAKKSKIYFYLNDIFIEKKSGDFDNVTFMGKTVANLYWSRLEAIAKTGDKTAFEAMLGLSAGADGEAAEDFAIKLFDFFEQNPKLTENYIDVLEKNKNVLSFYFEQMEAMMNEKCSAGAKNNKGCAKMRNLFDRLRKIGGTREL